LYPEFLLDTRPSATTFTVYSQLLTRTLISYDPMVRFVGSVNPEASATYSLLVAAIYNGFVNGDPQKEPRIIVTGPIGNLRSFYSLNLQTLQAGDVFALKPTAGVISIVEAETVATQNYSSGQMNINAESLSNTISTFRASQPGNINFDIGTSGGLPNIRAGSSVTKIIIDGLNNFTGGIGLPAVSRPIQEAEARRRAAAAAAAASSTTGNWSATIHVENILSGGTTSDPRSSVLVAMTEPASPNTASASSASISGGAVTGSGSSTGKGLQFSVPASLMPTSKTESSQNIEGSTRAVMADGSALPGWIKFDPTTNSFSAKEVPPGVKSIEIKIQRVIDGKVQDESQPIQIATNN
jgi:hypothetical protein